MTLNVQTSVRPISSVATYVTSVVPTGKESPGSLVLVSVTVPRLSVAVGGVQVSWMEDPDEMVAVMSLGHPKIVGGVVSTPSPVINTHCDDEMIRVTPATTIQNH